MKFSELFNIIRTKDDDWFDPVLSVDSKFFIDPFLIFKSTKQEFSGSHTDIINFFNQVFKIIARSGGQSNNLHYKKARNLLVFPEVRELCLGYTQEGIKGSGSGFGFSDLIYSAMWGMVERGIDDIKHFEELGIFNDGIGADRISDITANLLKQRLIAYTQRVCVNHNILLNSVQIRNTDFDFNQGRWYSHRINLPVNPENRSPIILVPECFLDDLPEINPNDFYDYLITYENQRIRTDLNYDLARRVDKKTIVQIARSHPDIVRRYTDRKEKLVPPKPYNFIKDPKYLINWHEDGKNFALTNPIKFIDPQSAEEFITIIEDINNKFKHFVEFQKGYELLWNDDGTHRSESAVQRLYLGIILRYCEIHDIDVSKEANIGRGPVDFKFSRGFKIKTLLEIKLANNSHFWDGPGQQLPAYLDDNEVKYGFFMAVRYGYKDDNRINKIKEILSEITKQNKYKIQLLIINAEHQLSASKLRGNYS